jgi:outer membrane murein-binding lipoprotein Lpp
MAAMSAEPSDAYEALEARVHELEEWRRHVLPHDLAAVQEAVSLLRADLGETRADLRSRIVRIAADVHEAREALVVQGGGLAGLAGKVDGLDRKVDGLDRKVDGLDRKVDGLSGRVGGLEHKVDGLAGKVDAQAGTLKSHGETLASHGEMLAEILRRLPAAGE